MEIMNYSKASYQMSLKNIVVFVRGHNDFDHVLPILDYLIKEKLQNVTILSHLYVNDKCKKHIAYVKKELNKDVIDFNSMYLSSVDKMLLRVVEVLNKDFHCKFGFLCIFFDLLKTNLRRLCHIVVSISVRKFIKSLPNNTIILADFGTENQFPYKYLIKYSNFFDIPIIAYLHGFYVFDNIDPIGVKTIENRKWLVNFINKYLFGRGNRKYYDRYLVGPNQKDKYFCSDLYRNFTEVSRVVEIGVPRFTLEWVNKFSNINTCNEKKISDNLKVALFVSNTKFGVNTKYLNSMINQLVATSGVDLKIVPHTRSGATSLGSNVSFVTKENSSEVIHWADVGIVYGTSIIFEMLVKGVTVIIPKFIDNNVTVFEGKNICIEVDSINDLIDCIHNLKPINNRFLDIFIKEYVYGGFDTYKELMDEFYFNILSESK